MPTHINPAEYILELVNADFSPASSSSGAGEKVQRLHSAWREIDQQQIVVQATDECTGEPLKLPVIHHKTRRSMSTTATLLHRSFIKSYRDILVYGVRLAMYMGLAILMGTIWVRMSPSQEYIQPFINSIVRPVSLFTLDLADRSNVETLPFCSSLEVSALDRKTFFWAKSLR